MGQSPGRKLALPCLGLILAFGCSSSSREADREVAAILKGLEQREPDQAAGAAKFDFGTILARGQELRHEFPLTNPTDRSIRLLRAESLTPCCSAVGALPERISPGGQALLPILFKAGRRSGLRGARFLVQTDWSEHPTWLFSFVADLRSELEIIRLDGSDLSIPVGHPGRQVFDLFCRHHGGEGKALPETISCKAPLAAHFAGPPVKRILDGGVTEIEREIVVELPAVTVPGQQRGDLFLKWNSQEPWRHEIFWEVVSRIRVAPSGLILDRSGGKVSKVIVITSTDRPFRVTRICCPLADGEIGIDSESSQLHHLRLTLDPERIATGKASDIVISTDHPDQPTVSLTVLVLPNSRGV